MKDFGELTRAGQLRRLRNLAEYALACYDLGVAQLTFMKSSRNTTFRVEALSAGSGPPQRYVLRIIRPDSEEKAVRSELFWLAALRRETSLLVPEPVPNRQGDLLTTVEMEGMAEPRHCALFGWVPGRFFRKALVPAMIERVGEMSASLHVHSQSLALPSWFTRPRWDLRGIQGAALGLDFEKALSALTPEQREVIFAVGARVEHAMSGMGDGPDVYGLIHADLVQANYLFDHGRANVIDFELSGWGYFTYDMSVTLSTLRDNPQFPAMCESLFRGYRRIRLLSKEHEAVVKTFMVGRIMGHTLWLAALIEHPMFGPETGIRISRQLDYLRRFLNDG
jgi:Ser/Thr protein kinase RdoA (MazF antagonist)